MTEKVREIDISGNAGSSSNTVPHDDDRGTWSSSTEFVLSCLGYAVGFGNIFRFPYLCYMNGGGAFLIPYVVMLFLVGIPAFCMELAVGQYSGRGPMTLWVASPIFQGIGAGMVVVSFIGANVNNMVIGWAIYYGYNSFQSTLPWSTCNNTYNSPYCYTKTDALACESLNGSYIDRQCYNETYLDSFDTMATTCNVTHPEFCWNDTSNSLRAIIGHRSSPSEEYFAFKMLSRSSGIDDNGSMKWDLCLVLLIAWVLCYICVIRGIKSSGKVVYFTATFPYLMLVILFFRGVTLPGAGEGIKYYLNPDWDKLLEARVWGDAAGQIFLSLGVGMGGLMTYASYNKFHNNIYRDTMIIAFGNSLTSFFAGFVVFSILGNMAHERGLPVPDVVQPGAGLAFITYPEVVSHLPIPQVWSVLFFVMLITLGLDCQFAGIENIMTSLMDVMPKLRPYKTWVTLAACTVMYILGLTLCTEAGIYWLELLLYYVAGWSLVLTGCLEVAIFAWVYGADRLIDNIEDMVGFRLRIHWWICWKFVTPLVLVGVFVANVLDIELLRVGGHLMPAWSQVLGWLMSVVPLVTLVVFAIYNFWDSFMDPEYDGLTLWRRLVKLTQPTEEWGRKGYSAKHNTKSSSIELRDTRANNAC